MKRPGLVLCTLLCALTLLALPIPLPVAAQTDQGRIVFVSDRDGNDEIYVMNADGSDVTRLTNHPASDTTPAWSPDGTKIAFSSDRAGQDAYDLDIYVMNADGSGVRRVTTRGGSQPTWSPDGQRMLFVGPRGEDRYASPFYVMNADGSNVTRLSVDVDRQNATYFILSSPAWSPDGTRIAFDAAIGDQLNTINPPTRIAMLDGNHLRVADGYIYGSTPAWSPDGRRIAVSQLLFESSILEGILDIFIFDADGSNGIQITNNLWASAPTWSPDGQRLAFAVVASTAEQGIYTINTDGSGLVKLTDNGHSPNWSRPVGQPASPISDALLFPETGYSIDGRIREYCEQNGGLSVFGLPITPQQPMMIEGKSVPAQWFERNRLELHPENAAPYDVLLGRLGADRLAQQGYDWQAVPAEAPQDGCRFFAETGRSVCGDILAAWRANGLELDGQGGFNENENLALFGLPLTGLITMTIPDGSERQVQYFERARFELHPENAPPFNVLLGLLGHEVRGGGGSGVAECGREPAGDVGMTLDSAERQNRRMNVEKTVECTNERSPDLSQDSGATQGIANYSASNTASTATANPVSSGEVAVVPCPKTPCSQ